jgi:selenocysteine-specific elongation factor
MIVATAGHVDHGKTALVKALTGVDTDRLPEEKARGISIDLGFAYVKTPGGATVGFVDVPGHERFVRNMIAGVCAIDCVMLVVAADDGVMPQTREHLAIVDLLGVARGVAVISKSDAAAPERLAAVRKEVAALLAGTALAGADIVETSIVSGAGVDTLRAQLFAVAGAHATSYDEHRRLRYTVDRSFSVAGSGTVVTGTVFQGRVSRGDHVKLAPWGGEARVRGIQQAGMAVESARAGERCALNLAGVERERVGRGQWVVTDDATTTRLDVALRILPGAPPIKHWATVHVHIGTADVRAKVAVYRGGAVASGTSQTVQLVCDAPVSAVVGDRFIVRDPSAMHTLGGGVVIDPLPPTRKVLRPVRLAQLDAMATLSPERALPTLLVNAVEGVDLDAFGRAFNLDPAYRDALARDCEAIVLGDAPPRALRACDVERLRRDIVAALARFHDESPQAKGIELATLRRQVAPGWRDDAFVFLVRRYAAEMAVEVTGSVVRRAGHVATANRSDEVLWQRVKPRLLDAGPRGETVRDLARDLHVREPMLADFLHRKSATGELLRVTAERFYPREVLADLAARAAGLAAGSPQQSFTAAQFRDVAGTNRTLAIEILECLDRLGVTQRIGDVRKMRKDHRSALGAASS